MHRKCLWIRILMRSVDLEKGVLLWNCFFYFINYFYWMINRFWLFYRVKDDESFCVDLPLCLLKSVKPYVVDDIEGNLKSIESLFCQEVCNVLIIFVPFVMFYLCSLKYSAVIEWTGWKLLHLCKSWGRELLRWLVLYILQEMW